MPLQLVDGLAAPVEQPVAVEFAWRQLLAVDEVPLAAAVADEERPLAAAAVGVLLAVAVAVDGELLVVGVAIVVVAVAATVRLVLEPMLGRKTNGGMGETKMIRYFLT